MLIELFGVGAVQIRFSVTWLGAARIRQLVLDALRAIAIGGEDLSVDANYWLITLEDGTQAHIQYMVPGMATQDKHRITELVFNELCRMLDRRNAYIASG